MFTLKGISATKIIISQYIKHNKKVEEYESPEDNIPLTIIEEDEEVPLSDLLHERSKKAYYFLDVKKNEIKLWPNLIDMTLNGPLPVSTTKSCWWDRHPFNNRPIGCPIRYHVKNGVETYETEGIFCSFPCCKAYIIDKGSKVKYKDSLSLLTTLFETFITEKSYNMLPPSPSWKLLKDYGGHLSIQEYRATFGRLEYDETVNTKRCLLVSSSQYIQEKRATPFKKKAI